MMNHLDESGLQQLVDLLTDDLLLLLIEAAQALFHRFGAGSDLQGMLSDFPGYARHIRGTPRKDVDVCAEKIDEHYFLFGIKGGADAQRLSFWVGGVEGYELDVFCGLEVASVALVVGDLIGQTVEVRRQGCRLQDGFLVLDAFHVALVGVLIGGSNGDDTIGARHFELEIGVVRNRHELGVAGAPKNGVVCPMEFNHLKSESFLKLVGVPKQIGRSTCADGLYSLP
jgi:hypothetical protein